MPLHHHGRMPRTKTQQRKRADSEITLEQAAGCARHDVDVEPFDHGRWDRAVETHTAGRRPAPTTGGTLSATDDAAAQIRALANSENVPTRVLDMAYQRLSAFLGEIQGATGEGSQHRESLMGSAQQAQASIETALQACTKLLDDIHKAADGHARG
jgi:hypothetical protein